MFNTAQEIIRIFQIYTFHQLLNWNSCCCRRWMRFFCKPSKLFTFLTPPPTLHPPLTTPEVFRYQINARWVILQSTLCYDGRLKVSFVTEPSVCSYGFSETCFMVKKTNFNPHELLQMYIKSTPTVRSYDPGNTDLFLQNRFIPNLHQPLSFIHKYLLLQIIRTVAYLALPLRQ